jgi:acyl-CoA synthetase (AMP-forming)/AMP-acid ligase II
VKVTIQDERDKPVPVGEIGEICSKQLGQMLSYVNASRNDEALRDGWVHTGDVGYLDDFGFLYIVDRKRDMVVSGGFNVFPRQVEDVLTRHPAVAQAAVIGVPHPKWGEAVHAVLVLRAGTEAGTEELAAAVKHELGSVSAPKTVSFVDELPVNPAGKVDKKALRAPFWSGYDRQVG